MLITLLFSMQISWQQWKCAKPIYIENVINMISIEWGFVYIWVLVDKRKHLFITIDSYIIQNRAQE